MKARKAILGVLLCGLAFGQAVNPGRVNVVTTAWSTNWLTHASDAAALTDLGYSAWERSLIGSANLPAWLTAGSAGAPFVAVSNDADNKAAAATLQLDHVFDVRWYGAAGDGVADDTAAVQAAIDAASAAGGGVVFFPAGHYLCTVEVDDTQNNVSFVGVEGNSALASAVEAVNAGEYAITVQRPARVQFLRFIGAGNTKNGLKTWHTGGTGTATLTVSDCRFSECDIAFHTYGRFWWSIYRCMMSDNNYDWFVEGSPTMQAASSLIEHCYSERAKIASLRMKDALYGLAMRDGIVEQTEGFLAYITGQGTAGMGVVFDHIHTEANCTAATVTIDGVPTTVREYYLSSAREIRISDMPVKSMYLGGGTSVLFDRVQLDAATWVLEDGGGDHTLTAINGTPRSEYTAGQALNDVHHLSRTVTSAYAWPQIAPGPITDRLDWTRTNLHTRGSMAYPYTPPAVGGNTVGFSSAYAAPIHGNCMTVQFAAAGQVRTDGVRIFDSTTLTINKWYVWSLDIRTLVDVGYLSACWRTNAILQSGNMKAVPDRWTRYWGVGKQADATGPREQWVWNAGATNPTFLIANVQLVQFDTCQAAEKFLNDAAYVPDSYLPRPIAGANALASHDYAGAAADWTLTSEEMRAAEYVGTNANAVCKIVFPAALPGKRFGVYNNTGFTLTVKVSGQVGATVANGKRSVWTMSATDCVKVYEQP